MSRFNLTFSGEILTGADPSEVRQRFGELFGIEDTDRVERFFSGQTITLRRNLKRKEAAHYYHQLRLLGAVAALVKIPEVEPAVPSQNLSRPPADKDNSSAKAKMKTNRIGATAATDASGQVWAVGSQGAISLTQKKESAAPTKTEKKSINISARIKASKEAETNRLRKAEAENKRVDAEKALQKKQKRRAEAARKKAEAEEKQRRAEAARKKAEAEEKQRRAEAARKKAEAEEKQRAQAARKKAEPRKTARAGRTQKSRGRGKTAARRGRTQKSRSRRKTAARRGRTQKSRSRRKTAARRGRTQKSRGRGKTATGVRTGGYRPTRTGKHTPGPIRCTGKALDRKTAVR